MLIRQDGRTQALPAKFDHLKVEPGDKLLFITAGGGGWGDPLERDPEVVRKDVLRGFVSREKARDSYGVVLDPDSSTIDEEATHRLRDELRSRRPEKLPIFDRGAQRPREEAILTLDAIKD